MPSPAISQNPATLSFFRVWLRQIGDARNCSCNSSRKCDELGMIFDHLRNAGLYENLHFGLKTGLALLADSAILSLPDGRHLIDGERLIAMPQRYETRL